MANKLLKIPKIAKNGVSAETGSGTPGRQVVRELSPGNIFIKYTLETMVSRQLIQFLLIPFYKYITPSKEFNVF